MKIGKNELIYGYGGREGSFSVCKSIKKETFRYSVWLNGEAIFICEREDEAMMFARGLEEGLFAGYRKGVEHGYDEAHGKIRR